MKKMQNSSVSVLADFIESFRPIIYIASFDFDRADDVVRAACKSLEEEAQKTGEKREYKYYEFSESAGQVDFEGKLTLETGEKDLPEFLLKWKDKPEVSGLHRVLILREIHDSITDKRVYSALQSLAQRTAKRNDLTVIIVDTRKEIPPELENLVSIVEIAPPDREEIKTILREIAETYDGTFAEKDADELLECLRDFSRMEIHQIALSALRTFSGCIDKSCKKLIEEARQQAFKKSNLLELQTATADKNDPGGFDFFKHYLKEEAEIFNRMEEAKKHGVKAPAGVVLLGMPGCGKSLSAYLVAKTFACPLLKLDVGRLLGKYVGESEENLRKAIRIAERSAPCILWIDELEKAFAGVNGGGSGNGEVMTRMFGSFLTWLQEKTKPVYVFATANDITNLPPEFLRRGRFDEIFKVMLPDEKGIEAIFKSCIDKRNPQLSIDCRGLARLCSGKKYSGADIDCIVNEACKKAFIKQKNLTPEDLKEVISNTSSSYEADPKKYANIEKILAERMAKDVATGRTSRTPEKTSGRG